MEVKVQKIQADIMQIYQFCMSRKEYQEEGFWEIMEYLFMQLMQQHQCSPDMLEQIAIIIAPPEMGSDDFVDTAKEAYDTHLLKQKLENDEKLKRVVKEWKEIVRNKCCD